MLLWGGAAQVGAGRGGDCSSVKTVSALLRAGLLWFGAGLIRSACGCSGGENALVGSDRGGAALGCSVGGRASLVGLFCRGGGGGLLLATLVRLGLLWLGLL